jgi:ribosome biogenesis GTPase / thiamine phosphate phosphatase
MSRLSRKKRSTKSDDADVPPMSDDDKGGKIHRRVHKRKGIEKQWRKGEARWQYGGDTEADENSLHHVLGAPRQHHLVDTKGERDAVIVQTGGTYTLLQHGTEILSAKPRRSTTSENRNSTLIAIGDRVRFRPTGADHAIITHVYARHSWLLRQSIRDAEYAQVLVANIDMVVVTTAATAELLRPGLIDRYLIAAAMGGMDACVVVNKIDLPDDEDRGWAEEVVAMYRDAGYGALLTSCVSGEGLDQLRAVLKDKLSAFSGHSGVGKTSILNELLPELGERTAELSEQSQRGMHTTTRSTLYALPGGGAIADTPGIREFGLFYFDPAALHTYYPEFVALSRDCRFPHCTHTHEPDCAVRDAVDREEIHPLRYRNYLQILESQQA